MAKTEKTENTTETGIVFENIALTPSRKGKQSAEYAWTKTIQIGQSFVTSHDLKRAQAMARYATLKGKASGARFTAQEVDGKVRIGRIA